jgi:hypothetical protein
MYWETSNFPYILISYKTTIFQPLLVVFFCLFVFFYQQRHTIEFVYTHTGCHLDTTRLNQTVEIKTKVCNVYMWDQCLINVINYKSAKCHVEGPEPNASYYESELCGSS